MASEQFDQHRLQNESEMTHLGQFHLDEDEGADDAAALFAEDLPLGIMDPSKAAPPASLSSARLDRFDSLTKGNASDGIRHSR